MPRPILVVGGYGAVGHHTVRHLLAVLPHSDIVIAGRSLDRAEAAARRFGGRVSAARIDTTSAKSIGSVFPTASTVVLNTEAGAEIAARACIELGLSMVSVAASVEVVRAITNLHTPAKAANVALVTEVGLAPGLMNLMARRVTAKLPDARYLDLILQLGLVGDHGPEAMSWTIARANEAEQAVPLVPPLPQIGRRVIPVDFVDREKVKSELKVETVTSFLALVPEWATSWLPRLAPYFSNRPVLLARLEPGLDAIARVIRLPRNAMSLVVRARSTHRTETLRLRGENQSLITGVVAARTVAKLVSSKEDRRAGVIGMVDVLELEEVMDDLHRIGCILT